MALPQGLTFDSAQKAPEVVRDDPCRAAWTASGHQASHSLCTDQGKTRGVPLLKVTAALGILQEGLKAAVVPFHAVRNTMHSTFSRISVEFPGILSGIFFLLSSLAFQCPSPQLVAAMLHIFQNCNINIAEHDSIETPV